MKHYLLINNVHNEVVTPFMFLRGRLHGSAMPYLKMTRKRFNLIVENKDPKFSICKFKGPEDYKKGCKLWEKNAYLKHKDKWHLGKYRKLVKS